MKGILKETLGENSENFNLEVASKKLTIADFIMNTYRRVPYHDICHGLTVAYYSSKIADDIGIEGDNKKL